MNIKIAMNQASASSRLDRWAGACWVGAGLLLSIGIFHPDVSETTFSDAGLDTPLWVPLHAAAVVAVVLTPVGLLDCTRAAPTAWVGWARLGLRSPFPAS